MSMIPLLLGGDQSPPQKDIREAQRY